MDLFLERGWDGKGDTSVIIRDQKMLIRRLGDTIARNVLIDSIQTIQGEKELFFLRVFIKMLVTDHKRAFKLLEINLKSFVNKEMRNLLKIILEDM